MIFQLLFYFRDIFYVLYGEVLGLLLNLFNHSIKYFAGNDTVINLVFFFGRDILGIGKCGVLKSILQSVTTRLECEESDTTTDNATDNRNNFLKKPAKTDSVSLTPNHFMTDFTKG